MIEQLIGLALALIVGAILHGIFSSDYRDRFDQ